MIQTRKYMLGAKFHHGRIAAGFQKLSRLAPKVVLYALKTPKGGQA
jgi:hypothetical protein